DWGTTLGGDVRAACANAAGMATRWSRKPGRLYHDKLAHVTIAISLGPITGTNPVGRCDAAIIARSSAWLSRSFGTRPCHNQMNAIAAREHAWIADNRNVALGSSPLSIWSRKRSKLHAVAHPSNLRNKTLSSKRPIPPKRV